MVKDVAYCIIVGGVLWIEKKERAGLKPRFNRLVKKFPDKYIKMVKRVDFKEDFVLESYNNPEVPEDAKKFKKKIK